MKNKTVLITGSTDGIGRETALELAHKGASIILHARSRKRGIPVLEELRNTVPGSTFELVSADLSDMDDVRKMVTEIKSSYKKIDVLINNAGILANTLILTPAGLEMTFAVNYLSHFLLTNSLLELIKNSEQGRIINVSSMVHQSANFDMHNLQGEKHFDGYNAYACSKLANLLFNMSLARKLEGQVTVNALHPGVIDTKLLRAFMEGSGGGSVKDGAATSVYLASALDVKNITGKYFVGFRQAKTSEAALDTGLQEALWEVSEKIAGPLQ